MKTVLRIAASLAAAVPAVSVAQAQPAYGCDSAESRQFDFWVGDWDLTYAGGKSRNHVTRTLDGCVIREQFTGAPGSKLDGTSLSTYDRKAKRWKQTWVDNTGAYLDFTGGIVDGRMVLSREYEKDGRRILQRMVFRDIAADSLKWLWQGSRDGGATWKTLWEIDYRRVK